MRDTIVSPVPLAAPYGSELRKPEVSFKRCSLCGKEWTGRKDFLSDGDVVLNDHKGTLTGDLVHELDKGLMVFVHQAPRCGTTLLVDVEQLRQTPRTLDDW
jgi:hypothetical protein